MCGRGLNHCHVLHVLHYNSSSSNKHIYITYSTPGVHQSPYFCGSISLIPSPNKVVAIARYAARAVVCRRGGRQWRDQAFYHSYSKAGPSIYPETSVSPIPIHGVQGGSLVMEHSVDDQRATISCWSSSGIIKTRPSTPSGTAICAVIVNKWCAPVSSDIRTSKSLPPSMQ